MVFDKSEKRGPVNGVQEVAGSNPVAPTIFGRSKLEALLSLTVMAGLCAFEDVVTPDG